MIVNKRIGILVPQHANDFEIAVLNLILKEAGAFVTLVSLGKQLTMQMQTLNKIVCDELIEKCNLSKFNFLILISSPSLRQETINKYSFIMGTPRVPKINYFLNSFFARNEPNKFLIALNNSCCFLNENGLIDGYKVTCNDKFCQIDNNLKNQKEEIIVDRNLVTTNSSHSAIKVAYRILELIGLKSEIPEHQLNLFNKILKDD
ncbi:type 1 glutamine amidotransferase family protein [Ureaplasma diversum]|uniref:DJ-1/PfpI domain-containing protein n=1 Tax=Ureaplasma diversum NCTC 246 TaxID=1188241 RepID=A0A084EXG6_9BACT|nr:hypothetical protein [Ureaplasma diversum]KEZ22658.1 Hypothetical protein, class Iglutamine amidotransferase-like protein [Ureaplasma diversum NCTC 246]